MPSSAAKYFDRNASPTSAPARAYQTTACLAASARRKAQVARAMNSIRGVSVVTSTNSHDHGNTR